ncbi:hypothetical protein [Pyrococcus kukulkanii]|uniref:hypothetical protein n=1 Tax=Pyrococcus kukulkanii TaxID=1609559 RepID=UPI003564EC44
MQKSVKSCKIPLHDYVECFSWDFGVIRWRDYIVGFLFLDRWGSVLTLRLVRLIPRFRVFGKRAYLVRYDFGEEYVLGKVFVSKRSAVKEYDACRVFDIILEECSKWALGVSRRV